MRKLHEIANDLRDLLKDDFRTVRISSVQTSEQMLQELKSIHPDKLPGVIIIFESWQMVEENTLRDVSACIVLADSFRSGSDERALSVLERSEKLFEIFPPDGRIVNGAFYLPVDCQAASVDKQFACLALRLNIRER